MINLAEDCIKKNHSLRNPFRKENQLYETTRNKNGAGADDVILPKLLCYDELSFLKEYLKQKEGCLGLNIPKYLLKSLTCRNRMNYTIEYLDEVKKNCL